MTNTTPRISTLDAPSIRTMNARGVLARELRDLEIGEIIIVPFKYCSVSNIKKTVSILASRENLHFRYDNSGTENSMIQRTE